MSELQIVLAIALFLPLIIGLSLRLWFPQVRNDIAVEVAIYGAAFTVAGWILHNQLLFIGIAAMLGAILFYELRKIVEKRKDDQRDK